MTRFIGIGTRDGAGGDTGGWEFVTVDADTREDAEAAIEDANEDEGAEDGALRDVTLFDPAEFDRLVQRLRTNKADVTA